MSKRINKNYAIIRHIKSDDVVAKLANNPTIPDKLADSETFSIEEVKTATELSDISINRSNLSDEENKLINEVQFIVS